MRRARDGGQALVQTALVVVVLLVATGLAVDYGIALSVRREMQNAADAGALAGARELCFGARAAATDAATTYALANGATDAVVEIRDSYGDVNVSHGHIVWVRAEQQVDTMLMGLIGIETVPVRASAAAACGVANSGCGMWPITFPTTAWPETCGQRIYVWDDDKVSLNCDTWLCDVNGDNLGDKVMAGGNRGFLDMVDSFDAGYAGSCPIGGGASLIKALIQDDCAGRVSLPKCIPGKAGVVAAVESPVTARVGDQVLIPLFSSLRCGPYSDDYGFYISDVGCAQVVRYHKSLTVRMLNPATGVWTSATGKCIELMVNCANCATSCGTTDGSVPAPVGEMVAVSLLE